MIELPEAYTLAGQVQKTMLGKKIVRVTAGHTPHKFAWFNGDPQNYPALLTGKSIVGAQSYGGMVEIQADHVALVFNDGTGLRYLAPDVPRPGKHQRTSTDQARRELRAEVWSAGLSTDNISSFANPAGRSAKPPKIENCAASAVYYASG